MTSPYTLPDGNVQIAFSGGRSSAFMLHEILAANDGLRDDVVVTFQNTGAEMSESLDFVADVSNTWRVDTRWLEWRPSKRMANPFLVPEIAESYIRIFGADRFEYMSNWWVENATNDKFEIVNHNSASRNREPLECLIISRKYLPNQQNRFCTTEDKVRTAKRYLMSLGWERWISCVGFRADEKHRLNKPKPPERWTVWHPMGDAGVSARDVQAFWDAQPFDLNLPNVKGKCWLGNCDGCFLKSEASIASLTRDYPERARWWEDMEALGAVLTSGSAATFSKRYTRFQIRDFVERQGDWIFDDDNGALCQVEHGECTGD